MRGHKYEFRSWAGLEHAVFQAGVKWQWQWLILPQGFWLSKWSTDRSHGASAIGRVLPPGVMGLAGWQLTNVALQVVGS